MPLSSQKQDDPLINRLRSIVRQSPELEGAATLYEGVLPLLRDADLRVGTVSLTVERARDKLAHGVPLLVGCELDLDPGAVRDLVIRLADALEKAGKRYRSSRHRRSWLAFSKSPDSAAARIRNALESGQLDVTALFPSVMAGSREPVDDAARALELDAGLLLVLLQNALRPALRAWQAQLAPLAEGLAWQRSACYVCGAPATIAELQENGQVKHLRCGQCGADWRIPRLRCAHCGNEDHHTQRILFAEPQSSRMRLEVCDICKGYLKVISAFSPTPPEMLAAEDLSTIGLDAIAEAAGYGKSPPVLAAETN